MEAINTVQMLHGERNVLLSRADLEGTQYLGKVVETTLDGFQ